MPVLPRCSELTKQPANWVDEEPLQDDGDSRAREWRTEVRLTLLDLRDAAAAFVSTSQKGLPGLRDPRRLKTFQRALAAYHACGRRLRDVTPPVEHLRQGLSLMMDACRSFSRRSSAVLREISLPDGARLGRGWPCSTRPKSGYDSRLAVSAIPKTCCGACSCQRGSRMWARRAEFVGSALADPAGGRMDRRLPSFARPS